MATKKSRAKRNLKQLYVFVDTNAIISNSISEIVKLEVVDLVNKHRNYPDVKINWVIPEIVLLERKRQMKSKAENCLQAVGNLEKLVGLTWGVNKENIDPHLDRAIQLQISDLGATVSKLDPQRVDWNELINSAIEKAPPFSPTEKEKGFKDAIFLETFFQFAQDVVSKAAASHIFVLTGDLLLQGAIQDRLKQMNQVKILSDLEELKSEINIYTSDVDAQFAEELVREATLLFFVPKDQKTLYYKRGIFEMVKEQWQAKLYEIKGDGTQTRVEKTLIGQSAFIEKKLQKVFFSNRIAYEIVCTKPKPPTVTAPTSLGLGQLSTGKGLLSPSIFPSSGGGLASLLMPETEIVSQGKAVFQVNWSAKLNADAKLIGTSIDEIEHIKTEWSD